MSFVDRVRQAYDALRGYQAPPPRPPRDGEIALSDPFRLFGDLAIDPYNPSILVSRKGMGVFDTMRRDDQIKAALSFKKLSVIASGWEIASPEDRDEEWAPRRFVENQFEHLEGTFGDALLQILTSLDYGYSVTEKVFATVPDGEWSNLIGLQSLKTRRPHEFDFDVDQHGNLRPRGLLQWTPDGRKPYPVPKFLINVHRKEFGNWYGTSDLEAAYRGWWSKDNAYKWLAMYLERFGIPPIFAMYMGYTPAQQDRLKSALKNLQAATFGILPRESKDSLELWSPGSETTTRVGDAFIPALDKFDKDMARAILMPGLIGMTPDDATGSFSRARVHFDVFMLVVEHLRGETEELINEGLVRQMVALNFPVSEDEWPRFRFLPLTDAKTKELMDAWVALTGAGIVHSTEEDEAHIRDLLEFPEKSQEELEELDEAEEDDDDDDDEDDDDGGDEESDDEDDDDGGDEESDDEGDDEDSARQNARTFKLARAPNRYEKDVNFQRLDRDQQRLQARGVDELVPLLTRARDTIIRRVEQTRAVPSKLPNKVAVKNSIRRSLMSGIEMGRESLRRDLPKKTFADFTPQEARKYLNDKALWVTDVLDAALVEAVRGELLEGLKSGAGTAELAQKVRDVFEPYVGDPQKIRGGAVVSPHRTETIVRTNLTDAINQGRLVETRRPQIKSFVQGVMYSAILDTRTTAVCTNLDGKIFRLDDPNLDRIAPPRHFNCRSVLVPVTIDVPVPEEDLATQQDVARALEESGQGFGRPGAVKPPTRGPTAPVEDE